MVALLASFGAVTGDAGRPVITALGRWAARRLEDALPRPADPDISAAELIAELAVHDDAEQRLEVASEWLEYHDPSEILDAAESMPPRLRSVAADLVDALGEDAIPVWREFAAAPNVGPHARYALYAWGQGPEPGERRLQRRAAESAAAALDGKGPDEALCVFWETVRGEDVAGRLAVVRGARPRGCRADPAGPAHSDANRAAGLGAAASPRATTALDGQVTPAGLWLTGDLPRTRGRP